MAKKLDTKKRASRGYKRWLAAIGTLKDTRAWQGLIPLALFLIVTMPAGVFLVLNVPAMWAPDGGAHVARVFQIAEGGIRPVYINHNHGVGYGGAIPTNVVDLKNFELGVIGRAPTTPGMDTLSKLITPQDKATIAQISSQKVSKQNVMISYVNTAAYSPVAYAPQVLGVWTGMKLNFNLGHTLLLARLCSLFTFLICVSYALFTLRKSTLKWMVLTVSLLPLGVFQSAVITADSFLISVAILFSAIVLKALATTSPLTLVDKIVLYICVLLIPLVKSVYFPLVFLILALPKRHWATRKGYWLWAASGLVISMIGFAIWMHLTTDVAASNGLVRGDTLWNYGDAARQQHHVLTHPFGYLQVLFDSIVYVSKTYMDNFFGWLGFTYLPIPGVAMVAGYLSMLFSVLIAGKVPIQRQVSWIVLGVVAVTALIIFTTLYVYYTLPGNSVVEGVQGRYFLPITVLFLAGLAGCVPKLRIADSGYTTAKVTLAILITLCCTLSVLRYGLAIIT